MIHLSFTQRLVVWAVPTVIGVIIHEVTHGLVADWLGDKTARKAGRLSLDPSKHISFLGTILLPIFLLLSHSGFVFAFAKPAPLNLKNFKHPRASFFLITISACLANFVMAFFWGLFIKSGGLLSPIFSFEGSMLEMMGTAGIVVNISLAIFNWIPLPPLDGWKLLKFFWAEKINWASATSRKVERYLFLVLLVVIFSEVPGRLFKVLSVAVAEVFTKGLSLDCQRLLMSLYS